MALRDAKLSGRFISLLSSQISADRYEEWELARLWEEQLDNEDAMRPSTMTGIDKVSNLHEILKCIVPWELGNSDFLRLNQDEEERSRIKKKYELQLNTLLTYLGF